MRQYKEAVGAQRQESALEVVHSCALHFFEPQVTADRSFMGYQELDLEVMLCSQGNWPKKSSKVLICYFLWASSDEHCNDHDIQVTAALPNAVADSVSAFLAYYSS